MAREIPLTFSQSHSSTNGYPAISESRHELRFAFKEEAGPIATTRGCSQKLAVYNWKGGPHQTSTSQPPECRLSSHPAYKALSLRCHTTSALACASTAVWLYFVILFNKVALFVSIICSLRTSSENFLARYGLLKTFSFNKTMVWQIAVCTEGSAFFCFIFTVEIIPFLLLFCTVLII